jgi:hypothetical protein
MLGRVTPPATQLPRQAEAYACFCLELQGGK